MDRLRDLIAISAIAVVVAVLFGCDDKKPAAPPSRFDSVEMTERAEKAAASFCEKVYSGKGEDTKKWVSPPSRPLPKAAGLKPVQGGWTWVNLWASWCGPCLTEMPLLERWRASLEKDSVPVHFELWSVDAEEKDLLSALDRPFPGEVKWLRSEDDLTPFLGSMGLEKGAALPVHALVDPGGMLRCVRVGQVNEGAYGNIKAILGQ